MMVLLAILKKYDDSFPGLFGSIYIK